MRKQRKQITIISLLFMVLLLMGCEAEKDVVQDDQMIVKRCSMNDFRLQSDEKLMKAVSKLNGFRPKRQQNGAMARMIYDEKTGLYYDDEKGIFVSKDGKESYTFPIFQVDPNEKIKNITFNKNESNGYDVYLVHYDFSKEEAEMYSKEVLSQRDVKYEVILKNDVAYSAERRWWICVDTYSYTNDAPLDNGNLTGNFGWQWVLVSRQCESGGTDEPENPFPYIIQDPVSDPGNPGGGGGTPPTNPTPSITPPSTTENPDDDGSSIITATIVDNDIDRDQEPDIDDSVVIESLNRLTNRQEVKERIVEIKEQVSTVQMEQGSEFFIDPDNPTNPFEREDLTPAFDGIEFNPVYPE
jgi:hypothetical protein